MDFVLPVYNAPDFTEEQFTSAPDVTTAVVTEDGVAPELFHGTSMFPEYFKINGEWRLAEESRMDCCVVLRDTGEIEVVEFRNLKKGDRVILGRTDDGMDGIFLHSNGFQDQFIPGDAFAFRTGRSRETAFSQDYDTLYNLLMYERENHGNVLWVMGPACAFDADARNSMRYLIEKGFVQGILAGNALATHDLEAALFGTALGQNIYTQKPQHNGHYNHIEVLNRVRRAGSIKAFIDTYKINDGIIEGCVRNDIPFVLAGSIRDDGPMPEVFGNVYEAQDAMREQIRKATTVICLATQLHTIAACNMTPSYRVVDGKIRPLFIYTVDVSEFAINKLSDRGSLSATGIITNAQDFIVMVAKGVQKKIEQD
ncbi:MAG: hypothetical protein IJI07_02330 [Flexilinea sp.]|nr:hypothetical protein [Flexilinea sp.]